MNTKDITYVATTVTIATVLSLGVLYITKAIDLTLLTFSITSAITSFVIGAIDREINPPKSMIGAVFIVLAVVTGFSMMYTVKSLILAVENMEKIGVYIELTKLIIQTVVTSILGVLGANLLKGSKVEVAVTSDYPVKRIEVEPLEKK